MEAKATPPKFLDLLNEVYAEEDKKSAQRPDNGYRHNPSSASMVTDEGRVVGSCVRALYYRATKEPISDPKPLTSRLQAGFGNGVGDYIVKQLLKSDKIKLVAEAPGKVIVDPLTQEVSFRLDGLVTYKGELGCLELKTMQSFGLQKMVRDGGPKEAHLLQVLCYFGTNPDLRWASLVYFGRDNAFRAEYHVYRDPATQKFMIRGVTPEKAEKPITELSFDKIVSRWSKLEALVAKKELPPRDYKAVLDKEGCVTPERTKNGVKYSTDFSCKYCSYQTKCWSSEDAYKFSRNTEFEARKA